MGPFSGLIRRAILQQVKRAAESETGSSNLLNYLGKCFGQNHPHRSLQADVAQLVEQPIRNRQVSGSSPLVGSIFLAQGPLDPLRLSPSVTGNGI
jgi:hypothetical protein